MDYNLFVCGLLAKWLIEVVNNLTFRGSIALL